MIETHPNLECPSDDAVLWRFMDFTKFVHTLESGGLWFTQLKRMEDPYEGAVTKRIAEGDVGFYRERFVGDDAEKRYKGWLKSSFLDMRENCCVSCWYMGPHESAAMWKLYLKSDEGVAVRTTLGAIRRAFATSPELLHPAAVKYIDYATDEYSLHNAYFSVIHKRKSFEHESEVRLIWWYGAEANRKLPGSKTDRHGNFDHPGRLIKVDVAQLIHEVYVSPTSAGWFRDLVEAVTRKYGLPCPVIKSNLYTDPVW